MPGPEAFDSWCVLELMGHVRMAGRVTEEERFGVKMGRIDVPDADRTCPDCGGHGHGPDTADGPNVDEQGPCPVCGGKGRVAAFTTVYFGGGSVYRMTPTTEEVARVVARGSQPEPVHRWELPKPERAKAVLDGEPDDDPDDEIPY
jgi:hypothetical protein